MTPTKRLYLGFAACALCGLAQLALAEPAPAPLLLAHQTHKHHRHHPHEADMARERGEAPSNAPRFSPAQSIAARDYFAEEGHQGYVGGTMHPNTMPMRAWQLGQSLPHGVAFYPLPRPLILAMGTAPAGYRYVRVGSDILLLATPSGMVVDVIENVAR